MNARLDVSCMLLSALLLYSGIHRARVISAGESSEPAVVRGGIVGLPLFTDADSLDDAAATIVANNPFRLSNKPASVRFLALVPGVVPAAPMRPQFTLRAIIGGPPWSAIVDGIPGEAGGVVVTTGRVFDKIRIRAVTRDTVFLQAPDTTWKLTLSATP